MNYGVLVSSDTDRDATAFSQCAKKQRSNPDCWPSTHSLCTRVQTTRTNSDGSCYIGEFCATHNKRHGRGKFINSRKDKYDGEWMDDRRHGYGVYMWLNGDYYKGNWEHGRMHGQGVFHWKSGDEYTGEWMKGHMHGIGTKVMANGDSYEGQWRNDRANGHGVKRFSGGDRHEGEYVNDKRHGPGVYYWASGDKYEGNWEAGKMQGYGVKQMANGDIYRGEWYQDKPHNYGEKHFVGGDRHFGYYRADKRHGYGVYTWKHGDRFEGMWVDGQLKGIGTYYYDSKSVFKGEWQNGRKHGEGIFTTKNKSYHETWENGVRTSRHPAEKYFPPRLLRTTQEDAAKANQGCEIRHEIDRLQALLATMHAGVLHDNLEKGPMHMGSQEGAQKSDEEYRENPQSESVTEPKVDSSPKSDDQCKICYNANINCVLIRCGHMCTCMDCSKKMEKCPICRKHIDDVIQTFRA